MSSSRPTRPSLRARYGLPSSLPLPLAPSSLSRLKPSVNVLSQIKAQINKIRSFEHKAEHPDSMADKDMMVYHTP